MTKGTEGLKRIFIIVIIIYIGLKRPAGGGFT